MPFLKSNTPNGFDFLLPDHSPDAILTQNSSPDTRVTRTRMNSG